jgi:amicyanin
MANTIAPPMYELCLMHARADRAMRSVVARQLDTHQLTMMEWLALAVIARGPKKGLSMSAVAQTLDVTLPQVTALVAGLTEANYVRQRVLPSDRRGRQVMTTLRGRRLLVKLEAVIASAIRDWTSEVPPEQLRTYFKTVHQLAHKNNDT